jgi:hypothetical protein
MEAIRSSEKSFLTADTRRHIPEDGIFQRKDSNSWSHIVKMCKYSDSCHWFRLLLASNVKDTILGPSLPKTSPGSQRVKRAACISVILELNGYIQTTAVTWVTFRCHSQHENSLSLFLILHKPASVRVLHRIYRCFEDIHRWVPPFGHIPAIHCV